MIYFPEIDLNNKKTLILIFILSLFMLFFNKIEIQTLVAIITIIMVIINYSEVNKTLKKGFKKEINNYDYNIRIENLLQKLKKYKKKSPVNYKRAMEYWRQFIITLKILEDDNLKNYNQYFENAYHYLTESINMFQSFGVDSSERQYIDGMKYGDYENTKDLNNITKLTKELYHEGYNLLYNLSLRLNKRWKEDANIHNKEIVFEHPHPYNKKSTSYDFYL